MGENLLIFGIPIVILTFLCGIFFKLYKEFFEKYNTQKKINDEYISKLKLQLDDGRQLRKGFINQNLVHTNDTEGGTEKKYDVITEVKELERTATKSRIEMVSYRSVGSSDLNSEMRDDSDTDESMRRFYNGWINSSDVEWVVNIDGREMIINNLLNEIEIENK